MLRSTKSFNSVIRRRPTCVLDPNFFQPRSYVFFSQTANKLRSEYVSHVNSHDNRRGELDLLRLEIDDLRRALDERDTDLQCAEKEKRKVSAEKTDVARTVAALEADLRRVRRDAETFGHDLTLLRREKEALEADSKDELARVGRAKKQAQTQIRLLTEQLEAQKDKTMHALEQLRSHVCNAYVPPIAFGLSSSD